MMIRIFVLAIALFTFTAPAVQAEEFTDAQRAEMQKMFEEYLLENGETILNSVNNYQAEQEKKARAESEEKAKEFLSQVDNKNLPMTGNPEGDITIVEFFDYNCGYCRKALEELQTVLKKDDKVKVLFMEMPILGPSSLEIAKWPLASHKQGKYFEYHTAIFDHNGQKDEAALEKIAKDVGLDIKQLKKDKDSAEIDAQIKDQVAQAQALNIRGTPGFIINGQLYPGYMPAAQIKTIIEEARSS